eukprot:gene2637-5010_t
MGSNTEFMHLDPNSLIAIMNFLPPSELITMQLVCKDLRRLTSQPCVWLPLLAQEFGLRLSPHHDILEAQQMYGQLSSFFAGNHQENASAVAPYPIRFEGFYTDGYLQVSAAYCSEAGSNITCLGYLQGTESPGREALHANRQQLIDYVKKALVILFCGTESPGREALHTHRQELINHVKWAAVILFCSHPRQMLTMLLPRQYKCLVDATAKTLRNWSTQGLEHFYTQLYDNLEANLPVGDMLMHGMAQMGEENVEAARDKLRAKYEQILALAQAGRDEANGGGELDICGLSEAPYHRLVHRGVLQSAVQTLKEIGAAVFDTLTVSRAGELTCPVSCGVILVGTVTPTAPSTYVGGLRPQVGPHPHAGSSSAGTPTPGTAGPGLTAPPGRLSDAESLGLMSNWASQPASSVFSSMMDAASVLHASEAGLLPPVAVHVVKANGEYIEFEDEDAAEPFGQWLCTLWRVMGFEFEDEDAAEPSGQANGEYIEFEDEKVAEPFGQVTVASSSTPAALPTLRLRPVVWFKFFTREELRQHRAPGVPDVDGWNWVQASDEEEEDEEDAGGR